MPTLSDIVAARERIADRIHHTPLLSATRIGASVGAVLMHKCESLQKTGSFKVRGALNRVAQLDEAARASGVVTVMRKSLDAGRPVRLESMQTIADGLAAPMAGDLTYPIVRQYVDDVVLVSDDEIVVAMRELLFSAKLLAEGGGAAATAAVMSGKL